jgi:hypothetical protein
VINRYFWLQHLDAYFIFFYMYRFVQIYREATGTCCMDDTTYGDPVQKAEAMAFRRACARLGLGLHLYHEE